MKYFVNWNFNIWGGCTQVKLQELSQHPLLTFKTSLSPSRSKLSNRNSAFFWKSGLELHCTLLCLCSTGSFSYSEGELLLQVQTICARFADVTKSLVTSARGLCWAPLLESVISLRSWLGFLQVIWEGEKERGTISCHCGWYPSVLLPCCLQKVIQSIYVHVQMFTATVWGALVISAATEAYDAPFTPSCLGWQCLEGFFPLLKKWEKKFCRSRI